VRGHEVLESSFLAGSGGISRDHAGFSAENSGFHDMLQKSGGRRQCLESAAG
jgi:hypothetical protein